MATKQSTYTFNPETFDNLAFILRSRPGVTRSYLVRELIAAEAQRVREELHNIGAATKLVREELRSVREKLTA